VKSKILVIDDDATTREILRAVLEPHGYEVIVAADGISGVAAASSEKPDLVITDGLLPKLHGFRVCKAIKEFDSPPKVIILTGLYTKPTYKWEVKHEFLADDLLTKPVDAVTLLACVEKHLGRREADDDQPSSDIHPKCKEVAPFPSSAAVFSKIELDELFKDWAIPSA
jgi:two-component system OmpR family response regulator